MIEEQGYHLQALGTVLAVAAGDRHRTDSIGDLILMAQAFARFEPVSGAYEAILNTGDLRLLSDQALRSELAAFSGAVADGREDERMADLHRVRLAEIMAERVPLSEALLPFYGDRFGYMPSRKLIDWSPLTDDQRFIGLLAGTGALEANYMGYFEDMRARILRILELLGSSSEREETPASR